MLNSQENLKHLLF